MPEAIMPTHIFTYEKTTLNIYLADKGQGLPKHAHLYNHATFCTSGKITIRIEDGEFIRDKTDQPVNLLANEWHEIEALEDNTVFVNVFATPDSENPSS
jgi:quercetin dioxygenase-like cupin family protein